MKVKELIAILKTIKDKEKEIYVSVDEEGNDFRPICEICIASGEETLEGSKIVGYIIYPN